MEKIESLDFLLRNKFWLCCVNFNNCDARILRWRANKSGNVRKNCLERLQLSDKRITQIVKEYYCKLGLNAMQNAYSKQFISECAW